MKARKMELFSITEFQTLLSCYRTIQGSATRRDKNSWTMKLQIVRWEAADYDQMDLCKYRSEYNL